MRKLKLKFIIWFIRKYFPTTIKPVFAGENIIFYSFNWSADVQNKNTSYQDLRNFQKFLNEQNKENYRKLQKTERSIRNETKNKRNVGNYNKLLKS